MDSSVFFIFYFVVLIFSAVVHEVSHGFVAHSLGDPTAKNAGRLTLNPIPHIDPVGSILLPVVMFFSFGGAFGWAKPVPVNLANVRDRKFGGVKISFAGPGVNLALALVFGLILRFFPIYEVNAVLGELLEVVVLVNLMLGFFNLLPIPPLDGSHILFAFLPPTFQKVKIFLFQYGFAILLAVVLIDYLVPAVSPFRFLFTAVRWVFEFLVGKV